MRDGRLYAGMQLIYFFFISMAFLFKPSKQ